MPLFSAQEIIVVFVLQRGGVVFRAAPAVQGRAVPKLLDVVLAAGNALVAVGIKSVKVDACLMTDSMKISAILGKKIQPLYRCG